MNLLVVGTVAYDSIKTPFGQADRALGGSAVYCSLAASFFTKPTVVAAVGQDFGRPDKQVLEGRNIDLAGLAKLPGQTFAWGGEYGFDLNQRTTLFTRLNVLEQFRPEVPKAARDGGVVFLGNIDPVLQRQVLDQVNNPQLVACDTMNYWIEKSRAELEKVLSAVDILIINDSELRELTGEANLFKAAKLALSKLLRQGKTLVVKRGEYGVFLLQGSEMFYLPAFPLEEVFDPTGAGDTFAGGFLGYLSQVGKTDFPTLKQACVAGSVLASFCVEQMGTAKLQTLSEAEIKQRQKDFKKLTHFEVL